MTSSDDKAQPQRWSSRIEAVARCAWLLALLLVAGTALSRAHADDHLIGNQGAANGSVSSGNTGLSANVGPWDAIAVAAWGRARLSEDPSPTCVDAVPEDGPQDVGGPEDSEAEAAPESNPATASGAFRAGSFPSPTETPLRSVVRGLYAARAPPILA